MTQSRVAWLGLVVFVVVMVAVAAIVPHSVPIGTAEAISVGVLISCVALLVSLGVRIGGRRRTMLVVFGVLALIAAAWIYSTAIWRDAEYRQVTSDFREGTPFRKRTDLKFSDGTGWSEDLPVRDGIVARVRAAAHRDVATVHYADEQTLRGLFDPADYTSVHDVRHRGTLLYVLRSITLVRGEYRLTVFNLDRRAVIAERRVDRRDLE